MSEAVATEPQEKKSSWRDKTLKAAGASYMVGDVAMVTAALARSKNPGEKWLGTALGASVWFIGGVAAAVWGNPKPQKQLEIQASKLEQHFKQQGVTIADDARSRNQLLKKKSFLGKVSDFLYEHPSEMLNAMYAIGATMVLHDGIKVRKTKSFLPKQLNAKGLTEMNTDFWIGALILAGAGTGLAVKEDPDARKKAEGKGPLAKLHAYVAEKPLRVTSVLYGLNNVFLGAKAWQDHSKSAEFGNLKPHHASTTQLAAYLFANTMLFLSRRNQTSSAGFSADNVAKLEEAAAHVVASQPAEKQKAMLVEVASYMASQKGMGLTAQVIEQQLAERVHVVTVKKAATELSNQTDAAAATIAALPVEKQQEAITNAASKLATSIPQEKSGASVLGADEKAWLIREQEWVIKQDLVNRVNVQNQKTHPNEKDTWVAKETERRKMEFAHDERPPQAVNFSEKEHVRRAEMAAQEAATGV